MAQSSQNGESRDALPVRTEVEAEVISEAHSGARLRSILREIFADLRQTAAAIQKAQEDNSYAGIDYVFNLAERWQDNWLILAELANPAPYDYMRDVDAHIERIHQMIRGSRSKPGASKPHPSHGLDAALAAILAAETAVNEELQS